jgi:hypothetical protein
MSRGSNTVVSSTAYLKLVLHAAKYQTRSIIGLLVASTSESSNGAVFIDDVLPLFHTSPLAPSIELALTQADLYLQQARGAAAFIAGIYYSSELYETKTGANGEPVLPAPQAAAAVKIAEKIHANATNKQGGSRILLVSGIETHAAKTDCLSRTTRNYARPNCCRSFIIYLFCLIILSVAR